MLIKRKDAKPQSSEQRKPLIPLQILGLHSDLCGLASLRLIRVFRLRVFAFQIGISA
jgi:hypothetical protein